jgi:putative ABC transport system ATP-binding protein
MERYVLELVDVSQQFGDRSNPTHALRSVSLQVPEKQVMIVMGPSGAGKTTLLAVAGALRRPTSGEMIIDGKPL